MRKFLVAAAAMLSVISPAHAAYIIDVQQVGTSVIATGTGSLDLSALTLTFAGPNGDSRIQSGSALLSLGSGNIGVYSAVTGPSSLGPSKVAGTIADSSTGVIAGVFGSANIMYAPHDYVSGADLGMRSAT